MDKPKHPEPHGGIYCATHKNYLLSCEEYHSLWTRALGCCEICYIPADQGTRGWLRLHIDHDSHVGQYAVRGILCNDCNTRLGMHEPEDDIRGHYLRNPWWVTHFSAIGAPLALTEPEVGGMARIGRSQTCLWGRDERGWYCMSDSCKHHSILHKKSKYRRTWHDLHYKFGPRHIQVLGD